MNEHSPSPDAGGARPTRLGRRAVAVIGAAGVVSLAGGVAVGVALAPSGTSSPRPSSQSQQSQPSQSQSGRAPWDQSEDGTGNADQAVPYQQPGAQSDQSQSGQSQGQQTQPQYQQPNTSSHGS
jgi:hypothetical protein